MKKLCCLTLLSLVQLIAFILPSSAQVKKEPPLVVIAKVNGEIFYEKNKSNYKPKFAEVDISKYASGNVFAELKLSSSSCHALLVSTDVASDDEKNYTGYQSVAPGESGMRELVGFRVSDGFFRYFDRKIQKFNQSSKFYLSVDYPMKGIGMWYAKDCRGTYEITVYLQFGKKMCGTLPPVSSQLSRKIAGLDKADGYTERSKTYHEIHEELKKRGIGIGFFEAASKVTRDFYWDSWAPSPFGFESKAARFLNDTSKDLAAMNAKFAVELLQTGKLAKEDGSGKFFSYTREIDNELVRREQALVENKLAALGADGRREIVDSINGTANGFLARNVGNALFDSANAMNTVIGYKRKRNPNAQYDYGVIKDRIDVGQILTGIYFDDYLPNGIMCK